MRRLLVMRHAKSAWDSDATTDHGRPLNARGRRAAPAVAAALDTLGWAPTWILTSDAARARETATLVAGALREAPRVVADPRLYLAGVPELEAALREAPDDAGRVMVVGHNPGWETVVRFAAGIDLTLKTADVACLEGEASTWSELLARPGGLALAERIRARAVTD